MSSFVYKFPVEDLSVSGNVKKMRKDFLFYSSYVFRQYVLGAKIGKRHNLISLYHSSLHPMAGVSKDSINLRSRPAIKAIPCIFFSLVRIEFLPFFLSVETCAKPVKRTDNSYYGTTKIASS